MRAIKILAFGLTLAIAAGGIALPASAAVDAKKKPKPVKQLSLAEVKTSLLTPKRAATAAGYVGSLTPNPTGINECVPGKFIECQANWNASDPAVPYPNYVKIISTPETAGGQVSLSGHIGSWSRDGFAKISESGDTWAGIYNAPDGTYASIIFGVRKGANVVAGGCSVKPAPVDSSALKKCATSVVDAQVKRLPR